MKNETLVRAITGIDDDLIDDAHTVPTAGIIPMRKWSAIAACLMVIASAVFIFLLNGETEITVFDERLMAQPIRLSELSNVPDSCRAIPEIQSQTQLSVPMKIDVKKKTNISVSGGIIQVLDNETDALIYEGSSYETENNVKIIWVVEENPEDAQFEMYVRNNKSTDTVILNYFSDSQEWIIKKITK